MMGVPLDDVAHVVQVALTPVFLLSGIAALLNVIGARLGRVADQSDALYAVLDRTDEHGTAPLRARLRRLHRRLRALDLARAAGAIAGACICAATFALFLGALRNAAVATALFVTFGASVLFTTVALLAMLAEIILSCQRRRPGLR